MYVCVCRAINDRQVKQAICRGACTPGEVFRHLGERPQCGRCTNHMREMLEQESLKQAAE